MTDHKYELAVVGYESSVLIYRAVGAKTFAVGTNDEAQKKIEELFSANLGDESRTPLYAVIFVEETFYADLPDDLIEKFSKRPLPAVVPVPSPKNSGESIAAARLSKIVERAVGSDIFS